MSEDTVLSKISVALLIGGSWMHANSNNIKLKVWSLLYYIWQLYFCSGVRKLALQTDISHACFRNSESLFKE